jgi:peptidase M50-like protein
VDPTPVVWQPRVKFQDRVWLHVLLFALTIATTTLAGTIWYAGFIDDFRGAAPTLPFTALLVRGAWYSGTILAILGCHELGHYFACRYYNVDASLPFFIPVPILLTGTMGAFIRIREPIPQKRMLFDIGIAGPIAGFLVAVPTLFVGVWLSHVVRLPVDQSNMIELGEPLLFKLASWLVWGSTPDGYSLNMHPMAFAAWFGLLATALNLFPIGQLDGGHISYAVLGSRLSTVVTFITVAVVMGLAWFASSWIVWTMLTVAMLIVFGPRHPRVFDEDEPLDRSRLALAAFAVAMFTLSFTPAPIRAMDVLQAPQPPPGRSAALHVDPNVQPAADTAGGARIMELSGIWGHNELPFLELTFDGSQHVSGTTYWRARGRTARAAITDGTFDPRTNALRLEGDAPSLDGDGQSHYVIEGVLDREALSGTYQCGSLEGSFIFTRMRAPQSMSAYSTVSGSTSTIARR